MKFRIFLFLLAIIGLVGLAWWLFLAAPGGSTASEVISFADDTDAILVADKLQNAGIIKSRVVTELLLGQRKFPAGGYELSKSMNVWEVAKVMADGPQLLWVIVPLGWRKEQLAEKLQVKFQWTQKDVEDFESFAEGEYFPDTYLIPRGARGEELAARMHSNFNEKFAPFAARFLAADIKNDTALKIASLLQRESGGDDMGIIAGIIWNRLEKGMGLKIDATIQYAKGKVGDSWWAPVSVSDYTSVDSDYNTYLHKGLPPGPIASSGMAAWEAVLNPAQTDCLYYLHDHFGQIHCSPTYEGHLENIWMYLR